MDLLKKFNEVNGDPKHFETWMKQSCRAYSNHTKNAYVMMKKICDDKKCLMIYQSYSSSRSIFSFGLFYIWDCRHSAPILHHPNNSAIFYHSHASTKIENDACNLIPNGAELIPFVNEHKQRAVELSFSKMCESANRKVLELQEELGEMQRMSAKVEALSRLSSYERKFEIFEESLIHIQQAILTTETKIHKINSTHQSLMRITRQINDRSKRQNEFNEKAITANARRLARLQMNLNKITKEMFNQKLDIDELKSTPEQNYDQLKIDFAAMLDKQLNVASQKLEQQTNQIGRMNVIFCVLILMVSGLFPNESSFDAIWNRIFLIFATKD